MSMMHDLRIVCYTWQWSTKRRKWVRSMFRKCLECDSLYVSELHYVLEGYPMCFHCLSQNVVMEHTDPVSGVCRDCGRRTTILPDEPETAVV